MIIIFFWFHFLAKFKPERADSRPERADFRPEKADYMLERADFRPERAWGGTNKWTNGQMDNWTKVRVLQDFVPFGPLPKMPARADDRLEREDLRLERADLWLWRVDLKPERADLRPDIRPERPDEGDNWIDKQTNKLTNESPLSSSELCPLLSRCLETSNWPFSIRSAFSSQISHFRPGYFFDKK